VTVKTGGVFVLGVLAFRRGFVGEAIALARSSRSDATRAGLQRCD
jgi:hypothetical protein